MIINDLQIESLYQVFDIVSGKHIFSWLDRSAPGDIPPDVAVLPVIRTRYSGGILIIDTEV